MIDPTGSARWTDEHYPRCVRCGTRTYVSNLTGRRVDMTLADPSCPAWDEPEETRPHWPYHGSAHRVELELTGAELVAEHTGHDPHADARQLVADVDRDANPRR